MSPAANLVFASLAPSKCRLRSLRSTRRPDGQAIWGEPSRPILVAAIAANNIEVRGLAGADGGILLEQ